MFSCEICMEDYGLNQLSVLKCGHALHSQCLTRCLEENPVCPQCRAPINRNEVIQRVFANPTENTSNTAQNDEQVDLVATLLEQNAMLRGVVRQVNANAIMALRQRRASIPAVTTTGPGKMNGNPARRSLILWATSHGNSTLLIHLNGVKLFSHCPITKNLISVARYTGSLFADSKFSSSGRGQSVDICIDSTRIVYSTGATDGRTKVVLFDVLTAKEIFKIALDVKVTKILTTAVDVFAVLLDNREVMLYKINTTELVLLQTFSGVFDLSISANGIMAYRADKSDSPLIHLYNAVTQQPMGTIRTGSGVPECIAINETGMTVASKKTSHHLKLFHVPSKKKVFHGNESLNLDFGQLEKNAFSANDSYMLFHTAERRTIVAFKTERNGTRSIDFFFHIPFRDEDVFPHSTIFRKVNDVYYYQHVTRNGKLKLVPIRRSDKR